MKYFRRIDSSIYKDACVGGAYIAAQISLIYADWIMQKVNGWWLRTCKSVNEINNVARRHQRLTSREFRVLPMPQSLLVACRIRLVRLWFIYFLLNILCVIRPRISICWSCSIQLRTSSIHSCWCYVSISFILSLFLSLSLSCFYIFIRQITCLIKSPGCGPWSLVSQHRIIFSPWANPPLLLCIPPTL